MTAYARGANAERDTTKNLRRVDHATYRVAGSRGPVDIVDIVDGQATLIQHKFGGKSPWDDFGPAARAAMREEKRRAGGTARIALFWKPLRKPLQILEESEWPDG